MAQSPRLALRGRRRGTGPERVVVRLYRRDAEPDRGARPCDRAVPELGTGRRGADAGAESVADISAGKWRAVLFPGWATPPAVHGQHERRKFLTAPIGTNRLLLKFAGLGQFGRAALRRAEQLATAGWGPAVHRLHDGFLQLALARGRPLERRHFDAALLGALAEYLAFIRRAFPAPGTVPYERLAEMIEINVGEGLGAAALGSAMRRVRHSREAVEGAAPIGVDGRMFPHEWLETPSGYLKTDGVDHHRDHFWPGCVDIAWDVAGVITEFGL